MDYREITIILLLFNTPKKYLKNLQNYRKFKIIILDQSNDFKIKKKIEKIFPKILYYKITKKNLGFGKAINFLSKKVKTKYFLCTQPDVKINFKSILRLKEVFKKKKDCIISVPKISSYKNYKSYKISEKIISIKNIIGAIFLVKKSLFKKKYKFDENFFFYWEDVDLSRRVRNSKFKLYLNKESKAVHISGQSTSNSFKSMFIKNVNFKFGEYLYQYKYSELKMIKILREPITKILLILFYFFILNFEKVKINFFQLIGIVKFFIYLVVNFKLK